jgi:signal transduction histidine kinase
MMPKRSALLGGSTISRVSAAPGTADAQVGPTPAHSRVVSLLLRPKTPSLALGLVVAASLIVAESVLVNLLKQVAPANLFGVVYLLGVLVVSTRWGFGLATLMSVGSAIGFDYLRMPPGGIFPTGAQDAVAFVVFLLVALSANTLAGLARTRAAEADQRRREADAAAERARVLAKQQAALRRIAILIAHGVPSSEVSSAVANELSRCLGVAHSALLRYEADGASVLLAGLHEPRLTKKPVGKRFSIEGENIPAMVFRTGHPARMDSHDNARGSAAAHIREVGIRGGVGAPIIVDGRLWGAAIVGSTQPEPLPPDTEARIADFAELVATAIANAETRAELTASRARVVAAADEARRRFERDLHDGAQQRLVSLGLALRTAEGLVLPGQQALKEQISDVVAGLAGIAQDLREISRGIHPAILSKGGLGPALKALARRCTVPVELDVGVDRRLPECAEVAAYYVVAEALTNAAKHARAYEVNVCVEVEDADLRLLIRDDGIGGADARKGSGLTGLIDRVEALGGQMKISSHAGNGTSLLVKIPLQVQ